MDEKHIRNLFSSLPGVSIQTPGINFDKLLNFTRALVLLDSAFLISRKVDTVVASYIV